MQFTPENCQLILDGKKTMTRRVVKPGETFYLHETFEDGGIVRVVIPNKACWLGNSDKEYRSKWEYHHTYAICPGRGKKAVGRIRITAIRREKLQDISEEDSCAEGAGRPHCFDDNLYMTYLSFRDGFRQIWDGLYGNDPVKGWEANPDVWVISFELVS